MIPRHATARLIRLLRGFPVVTVTGPRQSGKTTLVRHVLPHLPYVSLETPREREFAQRSPDDFLHQFPDGAVIDEVQRVPEILSALQSVVDADRRMGRFVLTGSHNLALLSSIAQSLAGRTAVVELLPLSLAELRAVGAVPAEPSNMWVQGFYPAIHDRDLEPFEWLQSYLLTYAERDVRQVTAVQDLATFQRFLALCAGRTAQLVNMQSLGSDAGISDKTAKQWLSVLEACYLVHFVRPHVANFGKRLVKMPKMYFCDVGLAASLLGIRDASQAENHPLRGALFETMVVNEFLKTRKNLGWNEPLHFWRDNTGTEVDLVLEHGGALAGVEIKSGRSVAGDAFQGLQRWRKYAAQQERPLHTGLVYGGDVRFERDGTQVLPWSML